jgi:hypothetical protein
MRSVAVIAVVVLRPVPFDRHRMAHLMKQDQAQAQFIVRGLNFDYAHLLPTRTKGIVAKAEKPRLDSPARRRQPPAEMQLIQFGEQFHQWVSEPGHPEIVQARKGGAQDRLRAGARGPDGHHYRAVLTQLLTKGNTEEMFWDFVIRLLVGAFVAPIAFSFMLVPLASLLGLTMRGAGAQPSPIRTYPIFALLFLVQMYFWGLWAAYCSSLAVTRATFDAGAGFHWLYYVVAFLFVMAPLGYLTSMERRSASSSGDAHHVQWGAGLYSGLTIIAFVAFAVSPRLMNLIPAYGWVALWNFPVEGQSQVLRSLEESYFGTLDSWVTRGGPTEEWQKSVLDTCGKLVMMGLSPGERLRLATVRRDEYGFRVDVCAKMTANRVHSQPEFLNKKLVAEICDDKQVDLFPKLCARSGLDDSRLKDK